LNALPGLTDIKRRLDGLEQVYLVNSPDPLAISPALLPHQTPPPGDWRGWLLLAGRGAGKTYAGAAWLLSGLQPGERIAIVAPTFGDARDTCMEGPSGLLALAREHGYTIDSYNRSMGEASINGAFLKLYSADQPDRLRGPQHHRIWFDELAAMRYLDTTMDMALMGLRLGTDPRWMATTTPRPLPRIKALLQDATVAHTRATTYDNPHLPAAFQTAILARYQGTTLGRQELNAELLDDVPGALWTRTAIEQHRVLQAPVLKRIVVGVDPSASSDGAETGIIVAGIGDDDHGYVLDDRSVQGSPAAWARAVIAAYHTHYADKIIAERNNGGEMVEQTIRSTDGGKQLPIRAVWASRGKHTRAEPVSALYEQGRVHHVGAFGTLEDQLCSWLPGMQSPDRLDALVWALSALFRVDHDAPAVAPARTRNAEMF
jgi:phage terminase large subunit-like protein